MVAYNIGDLEFILAQIKVAEQNATQDDGTLGTPLSQLIQNPLLPVGLRTVSGINNNIIPGRENWGAADQPFEHLTTPDGYITGTAAPTFDTNGPVPGTGQTADYSVRNTNIVDTAPRLISNLIVDQTAGNPAALKKAIEMAGLEGVEAADASTVISAVDGAFEAVLNARSAVNYLMGLLAPAGGNVTQGQLDALANANAKLADASAAVSQAEALINLHQGSTDPLWVKAHDITLSLGLSQGQLFVADGLIPNAVGNPYTALASATVGASLAFLDGTGNALADSKSLVSDTLTEYGLPHHAGNLTLTIENVAPDEGISAPFNSWMTLFGQFFDHGLDLVPKSATEKVYVPLQPDDPLYVEGGRSNFMVITRTILNAPNIVTPFVDQNQTYTSHASHQVFLREYELDANGEPQATGRLLEGANGGLATWADIKAQARDVLGINLTDANITNVPMLATDDYGRFLRGPGGFPQVVMTGGILVEGVIGAPVSLAGAESTGHAFLDDIAHIANPRNSAGGMREEDTNTVVDLNLSGPMANNQPSTQGGSAFYDNELLDQHFITGDGRGNENIGLTAVHHVFHSEHNRLMEHTKDVAISSNNLTFINEWLDEAMTQTDLAALNALVGDERAAAIDALDWNGERLFQAARVGTEMQYQHMVFEEFARKVNPMVDLFIFNPTMDINPAIFAEFAHVVYRFGHSMLTETVDRLAADGQTPNEVGLIEAFLNPIEFHDGALSSDQAAGAIIRGMTRQAGNEIDEFVTEALRNNLVGLPLDLATINLARGRETGMPTLNEARGEFYEMTRSEWLKPYTSWVDFAQNLKNPASIINFIAAYGTHETVVNAVTAEAKRDAATLLVLGGVGAPADRIAFLNATGAYAPDGAGANDDSLGGLNNVDLWVGGLAESILPFGGMLGSTFTFVFEAQMERLQNGDRFYYLSRMQGTHFLQELENNSFSSIVMKNTDLGELHDIGGGVMGRTHLPGELFSTPQYILESHLVLQGVADPVHDDAILQAIENKVLRDGNLVVDGNTYESSLKFTGGEHVVLGGTEGDDVLIADLGDDTVWGDGGNDLIIGGHGINRLHGGDGDDIIYGGGDPEFIHGEAGNDVISAGNGLGDLIFAGSGNDFVLMGEDAKETFGGEGNDFILGTRDVDLLLGGEGNDWLEGGEGFDTLAGDNSELFFNSKIVGHDVMFAGTNESDFDAETGDDIMVQGESVMRSEGMIGFDWVSFEEHKSFGADMDMNQVFAPTAGSTQLDILRNRFDRVEAASGSSLNDLMVGDSRTADVGGNPDPNVLPNEATLLNDELTREGAQRITGLGELLGFTQAQLNAMPTSQVVFAAGNILIGGGGSDIFEGRGGNDRIDGDKWLNVRIGIKDAAGNEIGTAEKMQGNVHFYNATDIAGKGPGYAVTTDLRQIAAEGQPLDTLMFNRTVPAGNLAIVREIVEGAAATDVDIVRFRGARSEYTVNTNADGTVTVAHINPATANVDDGVDTLSGIERLVFTDVTLDLAGFVNNPTTGSLALSIANGPFIPFNQTNRLETGDIITASQGTVADSDTLPAFNGAAVTWQEALLDVDNVTITGWQNIVDQDTNLPVTGASFTVTDAVAGLPVRAVWSVVDGAGNNIFATSQATAPVQGPFSDLPVPLDPVANIVGDEDTTITITRAQLEAGVADAETPDALLDFINFAVRSDPPEGTLVNPVFAPDGRFVSIDFIPNLDFNGGLTIIFNVVDEGGNVEPAELVVDVAPINDAAANPNSIAGTTLAGIGVGTVTFTEADLFGATPVDDGGRPIDVEGDRLSIVAGSVALANPAMGTVVENVLPNGNPTGTWTFTPAAGFVANVLADIPLTFQIDDGAGAANSITIATARIDALNVTGSVAVNDTTPSIGQTLSAINLLDANGIFDPAGPVGPTVAYNWQAFNGTAWNTVGSAATFTVTAAQAGQQLRVTASYTDQGGTSEAVTSAATGTVGNNITSDAAVITGTNGNDTIQVPTTLGVSSTNINTINALAGDDSIRAGRGNDIINAGDGDDTIIWGVTNPIPFVAPNGLADGRDVINGGLEATIGDTFVINGNNQAETYRVYARADWLAVAGNTSAQLLGGLNTEIVITRNGTNNASVIAELNDIEEIVINTGAGADTVLAIGNFNPTQLNSNTITVNGGTGNDTVDISGLTSAHHVVLNSGGGLDELVGMREQDELNLTGAATEFVLTQSDLDGLKNLVSGVPTEENEPVIGVRDLSGFTDGVPNDHFIRLTDAHYGTADANGNLAINPIFANLESRNISNILGAQEADLPHNAAGSNIFFMAFGQYFDHGLDFLAKGGNGKIIIDGVDVHGATPANYADLNRGTVIGYDAEGTPIHRNTTSPFVDQNQSYGSHELVGEFLRESDGNGGFGSHLFQGAEDPNAPGRYLLPTLRELIEHHVEAETEFSNGLTLLEAYPGLVVAGEVEATVAATLASNFLGSGQNLLLDANRGISVLDHFIAGDGRTNENISLTAMHTVWARNHNFHVENLETAGFAGTPEELFQAAKMLNEAEYQRVVFTEFADALLGGLRGDGDHGWDGFNADADPRISHEFAAAAYRVGHSLVADTLKVIDADGNMVDVPLVQAFLNPGQYASLGAGNILGGIATQQAEAVDFNIVDAVRNDLVGTRADLFAFNVARGWDVGLGTMNQVRAGLAASTNTYVSEAVGFAGDLSPYTSWEDFQTRNGLSNAVINQFKQAYPDLVLVDQAAIDAFSAANPDITLVNGNTVKGIDRVDLWVGGLAEQHINGGQVGQTFWVILHEQFDRLQEADKFYYIDRFDNFDLYEGEFEAASFAGILARTTGLEGLPEDIFSAAPLETDNDNDSDNDSDSDNDNDNDNDNDDDDDVIGDVDDDNDDDDDDDDDVVTPPVAVAGLNLIGDGTSNLLVGLGGDDVALGNGSDDMLTTAAGSDMLFGGEGHDTLIAGDGNDMAYGDAGNDRIFAGGGNDMVDAGTGDDTVMGGAGDDVFIAAKNDGNDAYFGDTGEDLINMSAIIDSIEANLGTGFGGSGYINTGGSHDTLWSIENFVSGNGNDSITASSAHNVIDTGSGADTVIFRAASDADGDTLLNFEAGDRIDVSGFMNTVTLVSGNPTAANQIAVHFENIGGDNFTVLDGRSSNGDEFHVEIKGTHNLTSNDFVS